MKRAEMMGNDLVSVGRNASLPKVQACKTCSCGTGRRRTNAELTPPLLPSTSLQWQTKPFILALLDEALIPVTKFQTHAANWRGFIAQQDQWSQEVIDNSSHCGILTPSEYSNIVLGSYIGVSGHKIGTQCVRWECEGEAYCC